MKGVNMKSKKNRKWNCQGDLQACGCETVLKHPQKERASCHRLNRRWWQFKF